MSPQHHEGIALIARSLHDSASSPVSSEDKHAAAKILATAASVMALDGCSVEELCARMGARGAHSDRRE